MYTGPLDLILDVGNSRTKWALFEDVHVVRHGILGNGDVDTLREVLGTVPIHTIAVGSVAAPEEAFLQDLRGIAPVLVLSGSSEAPIQNAYRTLGTLGADRLANVVAGVKRVPGRPVLVIDAGTCITYDACDEQGVYLGGAITPGLRMRAKAMHTYSARLPKVEPTSFPVLLGTSTSDSLASGIHFGIIGEMEGYIRRSGTERPGMAVLITGGDALRFVRGLESGIFALPYLTLEGYHALLTHHRSLHGGAVPFGTDVPPSTGPTG